MDSFFKTFTLMNLHPVLSVVGTPDLIMITLLLSSVMFRNEEIIWQDALPTLQTTNALSLEQGRDVLQLLVNGDDWPAVTDKMLLSEINYLINVKNVVHIYGNIVPLVSQVSNSPQLAISHVHFRLMFELLVEFVCLHTSSRQCQDDDEKSKTDEQHFDIWHGTKSRTLDWVLTVRQNIPHLVLAEPENIREPVSSNVFLNCLLLEGVGGRRGQQISNRPTTFCSTF